MHPLQPYQTAEALERDLGNPQQPENTLSFARVVELDEQEAFPQKELAWLYDWHLQDYYVPSDWGGKFTNFEEFLAIVRVLARRDQTTGIAFTTLFWSFLCWLAGTPQQKQKLAQFIIEERGELCLGYSEKEHGSDLVHGGLTATKVPGGYLLNGEKWSINRATISGMSFLIARTGAAGEAKGLSLFMVDKRELADSEYYNLPKIPTHGIRGSDISGIGFNNCFVPDSMLLGKEGDGLEIGLKGFQITRTFCAAFSQGAADTALRTTLNFASQRVVYNKKVVDLPQPRKTLVDAFLDILICDCETTGAARGFSVVPEQFSVWAAIVKYFVPTQLETMVNNVYPVLGARFYMRAEHDFGIFQKILRDNSIISMFDGSTVVNLHALILQLRQITKYRQRRKPETIAAIKNRLETTFSLNKKAPNFNPEKLDLFGRGADDCLQGLEIALSQLQELAENAEINPEVVSKLRDLGNLILEELNAHDELITNSKFEFGHEQSPELFEIAKKYCTLHAAATCLHMWIYNRQSLGEFFAKGEWLVLSIHRLMRTVRSLPYSISDVYIENVAQELIKLHQAEQLFSIVPIQLGMSQTTNQNNTNNTNKLAHVG
jgi:alkylation response protein AidB-like acyl-CoA dehydrogenase